MIRLFQEDDLDQVLDVWYRASRAAHPFLSEAFLARERKAIANQHLPRAETWVIIVNDRVVGFISLIGLEVGGLFVDPEFQGRGFGRALMNLALSLREELELDVFKENVAGRRFYESCGFELVDERAHDETGHPLLRMRHKEDSECRMQNAE